MNASEPNSNEPPEEYGAEHFDDPLQQEIKKNVVSEVAAAEKISDCWRHCFGGHHRFSGNNFCRRARRFFRGAGIFAARRIGFSA